ncbi:MAG: MBL fold metallo-hydrolase [bacterium]
MKLQWCGQSGFLLTSDRGTKILTDPFNKHLGYPVPRYEVDAITVSHNHYDHNYIRAVPNYTDIPVLRTVGRWQIKDIALTSYKAFHDESEGAERGENLIFIFQCDGLRIAHLGDLGHFLPSEDCFYHLDVMLVPLGGRPYTIGASEARLIMQRFKPRLLIPMHYKTATLKYQLEDLTSFLAGQEAVFWPNSTVEIKRDNLPLQSTIVVFNCY